VVVKTLVTPGRVEIMVTPASVIVTGTPGRMVVLRIVSVDAGAVTVGPGIVVSGPGIVVIGPGIVVTCPGSVVGTSRVETVVDVAVMVLAGCIIVIGVPWIVVVTVEAGTIERVVKNMVVTVVVVVCSIETTVVGNKEISTRVLVNTVVEYNVVLWSTV
jgi:hypothetical protein